MLLLAKHFLAKHKPTIWAMSLVAFLIGLCFAWVIHPNNHFIFDDYGHFMYVDRADFFDQYSLLPKQMYNDRPGGEVLIWGVWQLFEFNPWPSHLIFVAIHFLNAILLFLFARKLGYTYYQALAVALLFSLWPKSTHAVRWISAVFDLLGATFSLLTIHATWREVDDSRSTLKLWLYRLSSFGLFFLAIRTKESVLTLPVALLLLSFWQQKQSVFRQSLGLLGISLSYLCLLLYLAFTSNFMGLNTTNAPYQISIMPTNLIHTASKYLLMFFAFTNQPIHINRQLWFAIVLLTLLVIASLVIWRRYQKPLPALLLISTIIALGPILPLMNMEHKLYLYIPSLFFFLALGFFVKNKISVILLILLLVYLNFFERSFRDERNWWWQIGSQNKISFEKLAHLPKPVANQHIAIYNNQNPASLFQYGPGNVLQLYFANKNLNITDSVQSMPIIGETYQINYNQGDLIFVGHNYQTNRCQF